LYSGASFKERDLAGTNSIYRNIIIISNLKSQKVLSIFKSILVFVSAIVLSYEIYQILDLPSSMKA